MRPELARLVLALVKPVRLVWPRLDRGIDEIHLALIFDWTDGELIAAMPAKYPALRLRAVLRAVVADDARRRQARHGGQR